MASHRRILLHLEDARRKPLDPAEIYYLEATGGDTLVRLRGRARLTDVRPLGELLGPLEPFGFVRIHRNYAVNPDRILEVRRTDDGWEVKLEPPVNRVLAVSRRSVAALMAAFGE